jgi:hypothetical protein
VCVRLELGPRDMEGSCVLLARRDTGEWVGAGTGERVQTLDNGCGWWGMGAAHDTWMESVYGIGEQGSTACSVRAPFLFLV